MRAFFLNEDFISACFWSATQSFIDSRPAVYHQIDEIISATESIRKNFPFGQAGSISRDSALELLSIAAYFSPKSVCEVGTYIGRKAICIIAGAPSSNDSLFTCDLSFDNFSMSPEILAACPQRNVISYFGKKSSTEMFEELLGSGRSGSVDFFLIDGRVSGRDLDLIAKLKTDDAIFVFDDFEGVEKGVYNAMMIGGRLKDYVLVRPSSQAFPVVSRPRGRLALMFPISLLRVTKQQYLPFGL